MPILNWTQMSAVSKTMIWAWWMNPVLGHSGTCTNSKWMLSSPYPGWCTAAALHVISGNTESTYRRQLSYHPTFSLGCVHCKRLKVGQTCCVHCNRHRVLQSLIFPTQKRFSWNSREDCLDVWKWMPILLARETCRCGRQTGQFSSRGDLCSSTGPVEGGVVPLMMLKCTQSKALMLCCVCSSLSEP